MLHLHQPLLHLLQGEAVQLTVIVALLHVPACILRLPLDLRQANAVLPSDRCLQRTNLLGLESLTLRLLRLTVGLQVFAPGLQPQLHKVSLPAERIQERLVLRFTIRVRDHP